MTETRYTLLNKTDILPLTCSRAGACCHGNKVMLNPWELACLAGEMKISPGEFRELHTEWSGTRLRFGGAIGYKGKQACDQYVEGFGCRVHIARPLACRLFPLGRQIQNGEALYMHQGEVFPCLESCSEVLNLPSCSVEDYLAGQETEKWELAQDAYLEVVQVLADVAFELLLDSGLTESGDEETLRHWRQMADEPAEQLAKRIDQNWLDYLMIPDLQPDMQQPQQFCEQHFSMLQQHLQAAFGNIQTLEELREASKLAMALALLLAISLGADSQLLASHWIEIAVNNGAKG